MGKYPAKHDLEHFIDGLLEQKHITNDKDAEMRIAQIKFYQQLGFTIKEITRIIDAPEAELRSALEQRVQKLREEKTEMDELIERANQIIARLSEKTASKKSYFESGG